MTVISYIRQRAWQIFLLLHFLQFKGTLDHPEPHQTFEGSIGCIDITIDSVMAVLSDLDVSSSMDPDELHPCLLKSCKTELAYPLWLIFRASLDTCTLPSIWKRSFIVPIFKKGTRHDLLNYRSVSLTSVCVKSQAYFV